MTHDPERSADMRLLRLTDSPRRWRSISGGSEIAATQEVSAASKFGPALTLVPSASPAAAIIAGAVVTLTLEIANEGGATAHELIVRAPLPGETSYRAGSLQLIPDSYLQIPEDLFEGGLKLGALPAAHRLTVRFQVDVANGRTPLVFVPTASARGAAVMSAPALRIPRRVVKTSFAHHLQRYATAEAGPGSIYELDDEEALVHEAADTALSHRSRLSEPGGAGSLVLWRRLDRAFLESLEPFGSSAQVQQFAHDLLAGGIACWSADPTKPEDPFGLGAYFARRCAFARRSSLLVRLGKPSPAELPRDQEPPVPAPLRAAAGAVGNSDLESVPDAILVSTRLSERDLDAVETLARARPFDARAARRFDAAFRPRKVAPGIDPQKRTALETALERYGAALTLQLESAATETAALDEEARAFISALRSAQEH